MKSECGLIEDGYTIDAVIEREPGIHPRVKVRYRPALAEERQHLMQSMSGSGRDRAVTIVEIIQKHLVSWDLKGVSGAAANHADPAVLRRVQPTLQGKILDLVLGYTPAQEAADEKN